METNILFEIIISAAFVVLIAMAIIYVNKITTTVERSYMYEISIFNDKYFLLTKTKGVIMSVTLKDSQKFSGKLKFKDAKGAETDAATVELQSTDENVFTASYDDPNNIITGVAGMPGVAALKIIAKDDNGNVLPFDDVAIEVTSGNAVSGVLDSVEITEQ